MTASPPPLDILDREPGQRTAGGVAYRKPVFYGGGLKHGESPGRSQLARGSVREPAQLVPAHFRFGPAAESGRRAFLGSYAGDRAAAVSLAHGKLLNPACAAATAGRNAVAQENHVRVHAPMMERMDEQNYRPEG